MESTTKDTVKVPKLTNRGAFKDWSETLQQYFRSKNLDYLLHYNVKPPILLEEQTEQQENPADLSSDPKDRIIHAKLHYRLPAKWMQNQTLKRFPDHFKEVLTDTPEGLIHVYYLQSPDRPSMLTHLMSKSLICVINTDLYQIIHDEETFLKAEVKLTTNINTIRTVIRCSLSQDFLHAFDTSIDVHKT